MVSGVGWFVVQGRSEKGTGRKGTETKKHTTENAMTISLPLPDVLKNLVFASFVESRFHFWVLGLSGHQADTSNFEQIRAFSATRSGTLRVLPWREDTNLGVFDLCHFNLLKQGCAYSGGFGATV